MSAKDGITGGPHGSLVQFEKKDSTSTAAEDTERYSYNEQKHSKIAFNQAHKVQTKTPHFVHRLQRGAQTLAEPSKELSNGSKDSRKEDLEGIDPAIADALKVLKNRQTGVKLSSSSRRQT